jgi:hypothetical protein
MAVHLGINSCLNAEANVVCLHVKLNLINKTIFNSLALFFCRRMQRKCVHAHMYVGISRVSACEKITVGPENNHQKNKKQIYRLHLN